MTDTLPQKAATHAGRFHADDLFCAALLLLLNPQVEILRTFAPPPDFDGLVFDIGGGPFDHHQPDAEVRENGVKYASFGLLWRAFGTALLCPEDAARLDLHFIQPLDLDDNTGCGHPLAETLGLWNPAWDAPSSQTDALFFEAAELARRILEKKLESVRAAGRARALVLDALTRMQDGVVLLEQYAPWKSALSESDAQFVIYPSQRGGYAAQAVPAPHAAGTPPHLKAPFPADWRGLTGAQLEQAAGIDGLLFCHASGFLLSGQNTDCLLAACRAAVAAAQA